MHIHLSVPSQYGDVRECLKAAKGNLERVKQMLAEPVVESSEAASLILREVEVELGCVAAILQAGAASKPDAEMRRALLDLQREVAVLAQLFAEADRLFSGWIAAIQSKRAGYNGQGQAAPLVLVHQMSLEG
jgi:F0F1-type ATP synthase membrane subunit b/b'